MSHRDRQHMYEAGIYWIIRERAGNNNGWPPRDLNKVCGWQVVRMLAHLTNRSAREVASDVVRQSLAIEASNTELDLINWEKYNG